MVKPLFLLVLATTRLSLGRQNYAGWFGTGALFMTVAAVLEKDIKLERSQLSLPLVVYLSNLPSPHYWLCSWVLDSRAVVEWVWLSCCPVVDGTTELGIHCR